MVEVGEELAARTEIEGQLVVEGLEFVVEVPVVVAAAVGLGSNFDTGKDLPQSLAVLVGTEVIAGVVGVLAIETLVDLMLPIEEELGPHC